MSYSSGPENWYSGRSLEAEALGMPSLSIPTECGQGKESMGIHLLYTLMFPSSTFPVRYLQTNGSC